jgi:23S rRNA pseudouridine1911/1915/1917 synthase
MAKIITERTLTYDAPAGQRKTRIDKWLANVMGQSSRTKIRRWIDLEFVTVNGETTKASYQVAPGDRVVVTIPISPRPEYAEPEAIPLDVRYEDEYLFIVNKPPGMVTHPSYGHYTGTLVNAALHHAEKLSRRGDDASRPGVVHRIDKDTSGLLVLAKDEETHAELAKLFFHHYIERQYWTVIWGAMPEPSGTIAESLGRDNRDRKKFAVVEPGKGKHAVTNYETLETFDIASLVRVTLETGRTHQIRVHFSSKGRPVFGDETYGGRNIRHAGGLPGVKRRVDRLLKIMPRQALHAKTLGFTHPRTGEKLLFDCEPPKDFQDLLRALRAQKARLKEKLKDR